MNVYRKHGVNRTDWADVRDWLSARAPFTNNGKTFYGYPGNTHGHHGRLSCDEIYTIDADRPDYVIYSYNTPIAWHGDRGWIVSDRSFSRTTAGHIGVVRTAIGSLVDH